MGNKFHGLVSLLSTLITIFDLIVNMKNKKSPRKWGLYNIYGKKLYWLLSFNSTLRLRAFSLGVLSLFSNMVGPKPCAFKRFDSTPLDSRYLLTMFARSSESFILKLIAPSLLVWPSTRIL